MKKFMKKKVNVFGKTVPVFVLVLLGIGLVSAALITSWGTITGLVTVTQGLYLNGVSHDTIQVFSFDGNAFTSLEEKTETSTHYLENTAGVDAEFDLVTTCADSVGNCDGDVKWYYEYDLDADGGAGTESRVRIRAEETGVDTLAELTSISWDVNVLEGYIAHVDVLIDTDNDGVADDALVFEYAKIDADPLKCDIGPSPTDEANTFDDRGIVDGSAYAWLSSGLSGGCATPEFIASYDSLTDWKAGKIGDTYYHDGTSYVVLNSFNIGANTKVIAFEVEVDNWIVDSESKVSHIKINNVEYEVSGLKAGYQLDFDFNVEFPKMLLPDIYTIETKVMPTA